MMFTAADVDDAADADDVVPGFDWGDYDDVTPHEGHFSRLGGTWWCDTCNSPYCDLA